MVRAAETSTRVDVSFQPIVTRAPTLQHAFPIAPVGRAATTVAADRAKATRARLIRKVYKADPLECSKSNGPMRVVALIEDPGVIR
jgi:hypothetical protein